MASASELLTLAAAQLGVKESPAGSNRVRYNTAYYGRDVSGNAYPWCCAFIWWLFREAGASELFYGGDKTASCTTLYNWYRSHGQTIPPEKARPGDLVFFNFDGNPAIMNHIGICENCASGYITTIDGNTGTTNEANGGAVMRRRRALSYVGGVARPNYEREMDMTQEQFNEMFALAMAKYEADRATQPVAAWAKEHQNWAMEQGITDGMRPCATMTRQEEWTMAHRLYGLCVSGAGGDGGSGGEGGAGSGGVKK